MRTFEIILLVGMALFSMAYLIIQFIVDCRRTAGKDKNMNNKDSKFLECLHCENMIGCEIYKNGKPDFCLNFKKERDDSDVRCEMDKDYNGYVRQSED